MHFGEKLIAAVFVLALAACSTGGLRADEREFVWIEQGVSQAPIIMAKEAPPRTRQAAEEFAEYVEKISGARPQILEGEPKPLPQHGVWVGFQPRLGELFPEIDFDCEHPEEIVIAANGKHLVIAGRDRWNSQHLVVQGEDEKIHGKQQEYGTANAVYAFLQDYLDVRWLWPGELGEDIIRKETIAFAPFEHRYHPQIRGRSGLFRFSTLGNRGYGRAQQWVRRQRLQLDSLGLPAGHAFTDWWERFHKEHREYFALQPKAGRTGFPNPRTVKLCQSNPQVWEQWLADVEMQLEQDPTRTVFSASPNDGWYSGHCMCEDCRGWDHPDGERRMFRWQDSKGEYVALSDRHVTFANQLARLLEKRYPEEDYYVCMLAYGHSRPAPVAAVPADNVIIASVANFFGRRGLEDRGSPRGTTHRRQLQQWGEVAPHLAWRPNTGSPAGWQQGLPDLSIEQTVDDLKFLAENNGVAISIDSVWEHWATQGPQYYLMAQLVWKPHGDAEAVLDDYYRRGFGPAAYEVKAYFELLEQARQDYVEEFGTGAGVLSLPRLYTGGLLHQADEHLRRAAVKVEENDLYRKRVEFVRAGLTYSKLLVENIGLMKRYWRGDKANTAARVRENWRSIEQLCERRPYAINWGPVRPKTPRMAGLHPDHPHPKWKGRNQGLE